MICSRELLESDFVGSSSIQYSFSDLKLKKISTITNGTVLLATFVFFVSTDVVNIIPSNPMHVMNLKIDRMNICRVKV